MYVFCCPLLHISPAGFCTNAVIGYSETLSSVLAAKHAKGTDDIKIASAIFGKKSTPLAFTDSFVLRTGCDEKCEEAALDFVTYMNDAKTLTWMTLSEDVHKALRVPRFLMPAVKDAWPLDEPYYKELRRIMDEAIPIPNGGLYKYKKTLPPAIRKAILQQTLSK